VNKAGLLEAVVRIMVAALIHLLVELIIVVGEDAVEVVVLLISVA
jgi:hypothetical protein